MSNDKEQKEIRDFGDLIDDFEKSIDENDGKLSAKQRDKLFLATAKFAYNNRLIISEWNKMASRIYWLFIGSVVVGGINWFLFVILPELVRNSGKAG